jgi:hypothetical protein
MQGNPLDDPLDPLDLDAEYYDGEWTPVIIGDKIIRVKGRPILRLLMKTPLLDREFSHEERLRILNATVFLISAAPNYDVAVCDFLDPYSELSDQLLLSIAEGSGVSDTITPHIAQSIRAFRSALLKARGHGYEFPSAKKMTPERVQEILLRLDQGEKPKSIAKDYDISHHSVKYIRKNHGLKQIRERAPTHRVCTHCHVRKRIKEFPPTRRRNRHGEWVFFWRAICKDCRNLMDRRRRNQHGGGRNRSVKIRRLAKLRNLTRIKEVIVELVKQGKPVTVKMVCYYTGFTYNGHFHKTYWTHPEILVIRNELLDPIKRMVKAINQLREEKQRVSQRTVAVKAGLGQRTVEARWSDPRIVAAFGPSTVDRIKLTLNQMMAAGMAINQVEVARESGLHKSTISLHWADPEIAAIHGMSKAVGRGNWIRPSQTVNGES